jgi:hypothetical protein
MHGVRYLQLEQLRRVRDEPSGSAPARDFQNALVIRLNDVLVADPDNGIISHFLIPKLPGPNGIREDVTDRSAGVTAMR